MTKLKDANPPRICDECLTRIRLMIDEEDNNDHLEYCSHTFTSIYIKARQGKIVQWQTVSPSPPSNHKRLVAEIGAAAKSQGVRVDDLNKRH